MNLQMRLVMALIKVKAIKRNRNSWYSVGDIITVSDEIKGSTYTPLYKMPDNRGRGILLCNCIIVQDKEEFPTLSEGYNFNG